ncbi:hypothetical protein [Sorangium sp. So ce381]
MSSAPLVMALEALVRPGIACATLDRHEGAVPSATAGGLPGLLPSQS